MGWVRSARVNQSRFNACLKCPSTALRHRRVSLEPGEAVDRYLLCGPHPELLAHQLFGALRHRA